MDSVIRMDTTTLKGVVERCVKDFVRPSINGLMSYVSNPKQHVYSVLWLSDNVTLPSAVVVLARIVDDKVVVHTDGEKEYRLSDDLLRAGIPREQLLLAYRGEPSLIPKDQTNDSVAAAMP